MAKKKRKPDQPRLWKAAREQALKQFKGVHSPQSMMRAVEIYERKGGEFMYPGR